MKNLTTVLKFQTATAIRETAYIRYNEGNLECVKQQEGQFIASESVEQIKKFADIYYTLAKAGLYREMDPDKLTYTYSEEQSKR